MRLRDVMQTKVQTIAPEASAVMANDIMWRNRFHHLVVVQGGTIVGVLTDTDLGGPDADSIDDNLRVRDVMTSDPITAEPEMTLKQAGNLMQGRGFHCLPIVENGQLVGIVTSTDLENYGINATASKGQQKAEPGY
jgi:acetoin utilization protein AcuB